MPAHLLASRGGNAMARRTRFHRPWPLVLIAVIIASQAGNAAPQYKVLQTLGGADGTIPWGGVILDRSGSVYGTASGGGSGNCRYGCGTVFELIHGKGKWSESVLYNFQGGSDGDGTYSGLAFDASRKLYGTTAAGGNGGWGTVFELQPGSSNWTEAVLYDFCSQSGCTDGADPKAGLVIGQSGELYGTAAGGTYGGGVIYKLTPSSGGWNEAVIHSFQYSYYRHPAPGGSNPYAGLILDASGNLYGTTEAVTKLSWIRVPTKESGDRVRVQARQIKKWFATKAAAHRGAKAVLKAAPPISFSIRLKL